MMGRIFTRWRWPFLIGLLLIAGLAIAFWPSPQLLDTARVTRGAMAVGVTDDGVTRAEEQYIITAPVSGYLSRIELEAGDRVVKGALIARMSGRPASPLDPRSQSELKASLSSAVAAAQGAATSLAQARNDLARAEALFVRGFLPKAQLEAARTRVSAGEAALVQTQGEAARLRAALSQPSDRQGGGVPVRPRGA